MQPVSRCTVRNGDEVEVVSGPPGVEIRDHSIGNEIEMNRATYEL